MYRVFQYKLYQLVGNIKARIGRANILYRMDIDTLLSSDIFRCEFGENTLVTSDYVLRAEVRASKKGQTKQE